jgi:transcription initiation factor IIE alpha subunit
MEFLKKRILNLYDDLKSKIVNIPTPKNSILVLDFLFSMPYFKSNDFKRITKISRDSTFRIIKYLSDNKIISCNDKQRNKTYYFMDLIKIIM